MKTNESPDYSTPIPKLDHQDANLAPASQRSNVGRTANFCANCGNKLRSGGRFCDQCGEQVLSQDDRQGESSVADDIKLPFIYKILIQTSCGVVLISFFLPWVGASIFSFSGWDILTSNISWHVLLAATVPIAAVSVAICTQLLYANPNGIKTYFYGIEIASSLPLIVIIILMWIIGEAGPHKGGVFSVRFR